MSTLDRAPLDGFEERLLAQLKTQIATQPVAAPCPQKRTVRRGRLTRPAWTGSMMTTIAAAVALVVAVLNMMPGVEQTALARAFPILRQQPQRLPERLQRMLRAERLVSGAEPADHELAYRFKAPTGTGYVIVDRQQKWVCLLVPGIVTTNTNAPCATTNWMLTETRRGLRVSGNHHGREDIVALLPKGSTATLTSTSSDHPIALHNGILTVVTSRPIAITTTVHGHETTTIYSASSTTDTH
jgi:hypothetical protein